AVRCCSASTARPGSARTTSTPMCGGSTKPRSATIACWESSSICFRSKGAMLNFQLRRFIEDVILERGYQLVYTPNVTREELFLRSGHLPLYAENQFPPMAAGEGEAETVRYRVKPMNCPMH